MQRAKSAYWLAHEIGMSESGLHKIRHNGVKALNLDILGKICDALDCEPSDIIVAEKVKSRK